MEPASGRSVLRYESAAALSATVLWRQTTARYSFVLLLLTVIDLYTRECLGICVVQNLRSAEVAEMLNAIALRLTHFPLINTPRC